jgi:DNA-directed RNA polymerase subunit N (RpoN/RPB10)
MAVGNSSFMKAALLIAALIFAVGLFILYTDWMNGVFLRCPHCGKIGSWRYDAAEPAVQEKDEDGVVCKSTQIRICRKCGKKVLEKWSDYEGRTFDKANG